MQKTTKVEVPDPIAKCTASPAQYLAENHVDWILETIRLLLIEQFMHGYKHGKEEKTNVNTHTRRY